MQFSAVHLKPNFEVRSPEFSMVINGSSTLEGDLGYRVRTDIIERLRFGSITSLPNRLPIIGRGLRYINPFTLLEGIELEATITGNAFKKIPRARSTSTSRPRFSANMPLSSAGSLFPPCIPGNSVLAWPKESADRIARKH